MREAAARLMARDQKGRDFFARGIPEDVTRIRHVRYTATLLDLMQAYARIRTRDEFRPFVMDRDHVFTMEQALDRMRGLIGYAGDWTDLASYPARRLGRRTRMRRRSATAAHFAAVLELAKRGQIELRQGETFAPDPDPAEGGDDRDRAKKSLFDAPPMAEQERMVEAILFATAEPVTLAELAARLPHGCDAGRGAGASAPPL